MAVEGEILELGRPSAFRLELPRHFTKGLGLIAALGLGWAVWNSAPAASLDGRGVHFLATLTVAVVLWVLAVWDEYVVSLLLLLSWVSLGIVPSEVALSGFSKSSWFLLLVRLAWQLVSRTPVYCSVRHLRYCVGYQRAVTSHSHLLCRVWAS